ncbi:MAG: hypothetical protein ABI910_10270 [Gemmatimonadota bacterium]
MKVTHRTLLAIAVAVSPLATPSLRAQDVTVHSTSNVRFHGGFGKLMSMAARFGGKNLNDPIEGTTYISGHKLRSDNGDNAAIVDLDAGRIINIDNKAKSYTSMTFEEMSTMMHNMADSMKAASHTASSKNKSSDPKGDVDLKYQVKVDRPGEHAKIAGADAERVFMTITTTANVTPEGEKTQEAGSMVFFVDEWVSKNAAQVAAMKEFQRLYVQKLGQEFEGSVKSMDAAFSANPQLREGFAAAAKERAKVPGVSVRSTTYVAFVPAGMTFDRQLALSDEASAPPPEPEQKKGGGLRGMMNKVKQMSDEAKKKENEPATPPKQGTMVTVKTEVDRIETGRVDPSLFAPPAGFKEVKMRGMQ